MACLFAVPPEGMVGIKYAFKSIKTTLSHFVSFKFSQFQPVESHQSQFSNPETACFQLDLNSFPTQKQLSSPASAWPGLWASPALWAWPAPRPAAAPAETAARPSQGLRAPAAGPGRTHSDPSDGAKTQVEPQFYVYLTSCIPKRRSREPKSVAKIDENYTVMTNTVIAAVWEVSNEKVLEPAISELLKT